MKTQRLLELAAVFFLPLAVFYGCSAFDKPSSAPSGLIATPVAYYSTAKARLLGEKYKNNLEVLVEKIVRNPKTVGLQFANNIASVGGIGFFTHSAATVPDERYLEIVMAVPELFETASDAASKFHKLFSQYGQELLAVLVADTEIFEDRDVGGYGLNLSWRMVANQAGGSRVSVERAVAYFTKAQARAFLRRDMNQADVLKNAVVFAGAEDGSMALATMQPQPAPVDYRPTIIEENLGSAAKPEPSAETVKTPPPAAPIAKPAAPAMPAPEKAAPTLQPSEPMIVVMKSEPAAKAEPAVDQAKAVAAAPVVPTAKMPAPDYSPGSSSVPPPVIVMVPPPAPVKTEITAPPAPPAVAANAAPVAAARLPSASSSTHETKPLAELDSAPINTPAASLPARESIAAAPADKEFLAPSAPAPGSQSKTVEAVAEPGLELKTGRQANRVMPAIPKPGTPAAAKTPPANQSEVINESPVQLATKSIEPAATEDPAPKSPPSAGLKTPAANKTAATPPSLPRPAPAAVPEKAPAKAVLEAAQPAPAEPKPEPPAKTAPEPLAAKAEAPVPAAPVAPAKTAAPKSVAEMLALTVPSIVAEKTRAPAAVPAPAPMAAVVPPEPVAETQPITPPVTPPATDSIASLAKNDTVLAEPKPAPRPPPKALAGYIVQIAFNDVAAAQRWAESLERKGFAVSLTEAGEPGAYRLRLGNFSVRADAERQLVTLRQEGLRGIVLNLPQGFRPEGASTLP